MKDEIDDQKREIGDMEANLRLLQLKYREKVQEYRLCELKIKELKRRTRHKTLRPLEVDHTGLRSPQSSSIRIQNTPYDGSKPDERSENSNVASLLGKKGLELTEENLKKHEKSYKHEPEEDEINFDQYSGIENLKATKPGQKGKDVKVRKMPSKRR